MVVFASGVSNSGESRPEEFLREKQMLLETLSLDKLILYFGTCSVSDPQLRNSPYVLHKEEMEGLVRSQKDHVIFRLPQVVGKTSNPNFLTNYLFRKITLGEHFEVWKYAKRNLIDVEDVAAIASYLVRTSLVNGTTQNIASPFSTSVLQLVEVFELVLGKKARYSLVEAGGSYVVDSALAAEVAMPSGVDFNDAYIEGVVRKYYGE
ncbi:NAD-dependent epimerase/dehydratase family protein [Rhizobium sp. BK251]|uniref:NAD-dependent epimerase/dehydratase family protein n=1 Tax=Rhizobium sp. BK251 TaxID=2512125 RepID=UPI00104E1DBF|nr:NAD-dependent epimerase/dehydratase family protein [Rhizobium sp. BK251]TCL70391.1 hypothetical protein EV286_107262 [Rhizobium sp. BK251]